MAKKKNFWYVLVISNHGPVFVTKVDRLSKSAEWDMTEQPLEFGMYEAKDLALGLNLNLNLAYPVCYPIALDSQPYNYEKWEIVFKEREQDDED